MHEQEEEERDVSMEEETDVRLEEERGLERGRRRI